MATPSPWLALVIILGLAAACASPPRAGAPLRSAMAPVPSSPAVQRAAQAWRYALPPGWNFSQVRVGNSAIVMGGESDVRVLDSASGRLRWRRDGLASGILIGENVVYGTTGGAVASRALRDGSLRWQREGVCSPPGYGGTGRVSIIVRSGDDFVAGCFGGELTRIAASGAVRARSGEAFRADQVGEIVTLPSCALGVTGWSSGAAMRQHAAILDCKRLRAIVPERDDTAILGSIGNAAVLDDTCCFGRADVYRPATIFRANLATGALSPEVDLTPEPDRYPGNQRPIGQGSTAMLVGTELYLVVDRSLYRYGDPRVLPASPQRIAADLVDFPTVLAHGLMAVRARTAGGRIADEIVRIRNGTLQRLWSSPESGSVTFSYDASAAPDVLTISHLGSAAAGQLLVRTTDRAQLFVTDPCHMVGANEYMIVTICNTKTLVGNRYRQYVAAYRWPGGQAAP